MMARFMHIIAIMTSCDPHCTLPLHTSIAHFHCTRPLHTSIAHVHCTLPLASSPDHSQILSRSRGCEIKFGSGLGTKLHFHCTSGVAKDPADARSQHEHSTFVRILAQNVETNLGDLGRYSPRKWIFELLRSVLRLFQWCGFKVGNCYFCCHGNTNFIWQFLRSKWLKFQIWKLSALWLIL